MDSLLDSGRKANRLIAQCRSLGKPLYLLPEIIPLALLVQTALRQMTIPPSIQLHTGLLELPAVKANPSLLTEVVEGVVQNALDAMPDGGELFISGDTTNDVIQLHIRDTGYGISPKHLPHLFSTPFFTTKDHDGSRLGFSLWLSRLYLQSVGGDIQVTDTSSSGTTFTLSLPVALETVPGHRPASVGKEHKQIAYKDRPAVLRHGTAKVLIVEDESNWQGRLSLPFIDQGWEVQMASSYDEAMRLLDQHTFAVFVVDVRLVDYDRENVDGLKFVEQVCSREFSGLVLILSVWETSLNQARACFEGWEDIKIFDKTDDDLDATLLDITTRSIARGTEHR